jgi:hypothetical protein
MGLPAAVSGFGITARAFDLKDGGTGEMAMAEEGVQIY